MPTKFGALLVMLVRERIENLLLGVGTWMYPYKHDFSLS